jgi:alcohol dehydrogenase class IV
MELAVKYERIFWLLDACSHDWQLLLCIPTMAGTGSEVSPNAILLDEADKVKKGVVSPSLVPDVVFADAELTLTVPPAVTAATGLDALTHCIEAYTNRFAHPVVDIWALEGIRLIASALVEAVEHPSSLPAREKMALGSLFGGLCLGPVNTAAVRALSYPLGGWFHIAHGHANAILLPHVMRFNTAAAPSRFAEVALALGAARETTDKTTAESGVRKLCAIIRTTKLEMRLSALGIQETDLPHLATAGFGVTRLNRQGNAHRAPLQTMAAVSPAGPAPIMTAVPCFMTISLLIASSSE